jgi:type I restriction-modification system DNA methylase subunit
MATKKQKQQQFALNNDIKSILAKKGFDVKNYTADDKSILRQYSGMGGLQDAGATGANILYEYYTPDQIISKMWELCMMYGFRGGDVLEPSCGIGRFLEYAPYSPQLTGYEIDKTAYQIATILHPEAKIVNKPFETMFHTSDNRSIGAKVTPKFNAVIGNPPYGNMISAADFGEKKYTSATTWEEYFLSRALDVTVSGGLVCFVIGAEVAAGGKLFLQKGSTPAKTKIAEKADLVDAYRLPNGVFDRTDVLTDIVIFKKK